MRISALFLSIGFMVGTAAAVAADTQSRPPPTPAPPVAITTASPGTAPPINIVVGSPPISTKHHVLLDGDEALAKLQISNPRHYAIARRIFAAATEICNLGDAEPILTKYGADYIGCARGLWLTSNPPKREIFFHIDDTAYSARVVVKELGTKLVPAE